MISELPTATTAIHSPHDDIDRLFQRARTAVAQTSTLRVRGRVLQIVGTIIRATAPGARIGDLCTLRNPENNCELSAEVIGFQHDIAILTPLGKIQGLSTLT